MLKALTLTQVDTALAKLPPRGPPPEADPHPYLIIDAGIFYAPAADHERRPLDRAGFRHGSFGRQKSKSWRKGGKRCAGNENPTIDYHAAAPFPASKEPCTKEENWNAGVFPQRLVAFTQISLAASVSPASRAIV